MKISVNCPSYKRPVVETLRYLPFCKVWVDNKEHDDYVKANPGFEKNIIPVPDGVQGNVSRIRNWILDHELQENDAVVLIDDDMHEIAHYEPEGTFGYKSVRLEADQFMDFIERYTYLCMDFGFMMWGVNVNKDGLSYKQTAPFNTKAAVLGPFCVFLKGNICRYDERLPLKEDYDIFIQNCNEYRGVLRVNKYHYNCKQSKQKGGCATYRNHDREMSQLYALQRKWGKDIVKIDGVDNPKAKRKREYMDYNPIIRIPIKGI